MTMVLPAARAGKSFQPSRPRGVFQGVIAATTPTGSRSRRRARSAAGRGPAGERYDGSKSHCGIERRRRHWRT